MDQKKHWKQRKKSLLRLLARDGYGALEGDPDRSRSKRRTCRDAVQWLGKKPTAARKISQHIQRSSTKLHWNTVKLLSCRLLGLNKNNDINQHQSVYYHSFLFWVSSAFLVSPWFFTDHPRYSVQQNRGRKLARREEAQQLAADSLPLRRTGAEIRPRLSMEYHKEGTGRGWVLGV